MNPTSELLGQLPSLDRPSLPDLWHKSFGRPAFQYYKVEQIQLLFGHHVSVQMTERLLPSVKYKRTFRYQSGVKEWVGDLGQQTHTLKGKIRNLDPGEPSLVAKGGHADLNAHPWIAEMQNAKAR